MIVQFKFTSFLSLGWGPVLDACTLRLLFLFGNLNETIFDSAFHSVIYRHMNADASFWLVLANTSVICLLEEITVFLNFTSSDPNRFRIKNIWNQIKKVRAKKEIVTARRTERPLVFKTGLRYNINALRKVIYVSVSSWCDV